MADEEQLAVLEQGVAAWNAWRAAHPEIQPDLSWTEMSEVEIGSDWRGVNFSKTDLSMTYLCGADLRGADLGGADLDHACLQGTIIDSETRLADKWRLVWEIVNLGAIDRDLSWRRPEPGRYQRRQSERGETRRCGADRGQRKWVGPEPG